MLIYCIMSILKMGLAVGTFLLFHTAYSMLEYRRFSQTVLNNEKYSIPLDIITEAMLGLLINLLCGSRIYSNFMPLQQAKLLSKLAYSEIHGCGELRPLAKNRGCVMRCVRDVKSVEAYAQQKPSIERLRNNLKRG